MHVSAAALLVSACLCVCVRVCLLVCAYLRSVAFVALFSICCCYQRQSARANLSAAAPEFRWSAHALILSSTRKKMHCLRFAIRRRSVAVNAGVRFSFAAFSFVEGNWSATQDVHSIPHTQAYRHTLRPACRCVCVCVALLFAYFAVRRMFVCVYVSWEWRREYSRAAAVLSDMATVFLLLFFFVFFFLFSLLLLVKWA